MVLLECFFMILSEYPISLQFKILIAQLKIAIITMTNILMKSLEEIS